METDMIQQTPVAGADIYLPSHGEDNPRNGYPPVPLRPDLKSGQETWLALGEFLRLL
jgi:hypothetical protein